MPDAQKPVPPCQYVLDENGIHEFIIQLSSLEGAYSYLEQIEPIYAAHTGASSPLLVIINSTGESLPMNYGLLQKARALLDKYPDIGTTYTATLTDDFITAHLADLFIRMVRHPGIVVHFFERARRDDAIEWLLRHR